MSIIEIPIENIENPKKTILNWPFSKIHYQHPTTEFWFQTNKDGFSVHIDAQLCAPLYYKNRPPKGSVFETDCLEFFLRPSKEPKNKELAAFYYGWEIAPDGTLLDYRAGIGEEGRRIIGSGICNKNLDITRISPDTESNSGIVYTKISNTLISFDYDWSSDIKINSFIQQNKKWSLALYIPWTDFGLVKRPCGETWTFTVNRIDVSSSSGIDFVENPALACMHSNIRIPAFHQPELFIPLRII